jgi:hypothetical protein
MRRKCCVLFLLLAVLCPVVYAKTHHSSSSSSKPVHVEGYYRKDGTYVAPHDRNLPGHGDHTTTHTEPAHTYYPPQNHATTPHPRRYTSGYMADGLAPHGTVQRDSHGRIKRSTGAKNAFKHEHPCPATGHNSGSCPGYVIDHVQPLECGGADAPGNMQWQSVEDGKEKDKTERYCR